jgi:acetoin utilization protein AcuB
VYRGGVQFALEIEDASGTIKDVADVIREYNGRMVSILTSYENAREGFRRVYIRAKDIKRDRLKELIQRLESNFRVLYIVDSQKKKRILSR